MTRAVHTVTKPSNLVGYSKPVRRADSTDSRRRADRRARFVPPRAGDCHRAPQSCVCAPPPYGRRTSGVRVLWVVANRSALHTDDMPGTTVATFVRGAVGSIDVTFVSALTRAATLSSIAAAPLNTQ
jgi:hypothetical protein